VQREEELPLEQVVNKQLERELLELLVAFLAEVWAALLALELVLAASKPLEARLE
jgi:hypothetical protein